MVPIREKVRMTFPMKLLSQFQQKSIFSIYMLVIQDLAKTSDDLKFKMAVLPIYGKNHSDGVLSITTGLIWLIFCMKHMGHFRI